MGGVGSLEGHCVWVAPVGPGAGLTPLKSGVWCAFPRICRPVPGPGGRVWLEADMTL